MLEQLVSLTPATPAPTATATATATPIPAASGSEADSDTGSGAGTVAASPPASAIVLDTPPPSAGGSDLPLPAMATVGLPQALEIISNGGHTPEDRAAFYAGLSVEQVAISLETAGNAPLASFFARTAGGDSTDEAQLNTLLEQQSVSPTQRVGFLGVFGQMRHIAMTRLLDGALSQLISNPDAADELDDGKLGGPIGITIAPRAEAPDGLVVIEGRLESAAKMLYLKANGRWVHVEESGRFTLRLPVAKGESSLLLEASDSANARATAEVRITSAADGTRHPAHTRKQAGRRIALFIGVEEYDNAIPELETPVRDARAVAAKLQSGYGFETRILANPSKKDALAALSSLSEELGEDDSLVLFYAGHGYLMKETGRGYWLPRDADTSSPKNWISNRDVARLFHRTRAKQVFMISDSCYSGAFTREGSSGGYSASSDLRAVMALSSGGEQPVWDGGGNGHSIFAAQLMSALNEGQSQQGLQLFETVRVKVVKASPQVPGYGAMMSAGYDAGADFALKPNPATPLRGDAPAGAIPMTPERVVRK